MKIKINKNINESVLLNLVEENDRLLIKSTNGTVIAELLVDHFKYEDIETGKETTWDLDKGFYLHFNAINSKEVNVVTTENSTVLVSNDGPLTVNGNLEEMSDEEYYKRIDYIKNWIENYFTDILSKNGNLVPTERELEDYLSEYKRKLKRLGILSQYDIYYDEDDRIYDNIVGLFDEESGECYQGIEDVVKKISYYTLYTWVRNGKDG